jgi:mannose-6-phosphate isomerase-like protein (cupin superfamily)
MNSFAKGVAIVLGPEDGEAFWQPLPSRGYVINKITPYTSPYDNFSAGIQVLEPGAHIRRHGHERSHEILFCFRGSGTAEIDGKIYDVHEETMMLIGRRL